jgi:signal transduction histidine kinase
MMIIYFLYGLAFGGLGLAAYLQIRREVDFPLRKELPWLAAYGFACGATAWVDMFRLGGGMNDVDAILTALRVVLQPLTGLALLAFGWGTLKSAGPLPPWTIFIPGVLIVPVAYVITYASTTFITSSPIEIPIDIWSRYLLYLPGSIMAGLGFLRQWYVQRKQGLQDVSRLMLGAGIAFWVEAFVVGLVVPAAPYGPASYYNYDRVAYNAFAGEKDQPLAPFRLTPWLDYQQVLETTGLPIQFWRMLSAIPVTFFVVRGLDVFDAIQKRKLNALQAERDRAQHEAFQGQIAARQTAERWTNALVSISRHIAELDDVDNVLLFVVEQTRNLLRSDYVGLALTNGDGSGLELKCYAHSKDVVMLGSPIALKNQLILNAFRIFKPYRSEGLVTADGINACPLADEAPRVVAVVPLGLDSQPIGAFWIARFESSPYSETDLIWLECLADQVVIAIKHGLMTMQMQSLSVTEERGRIAREMHDGLAQVLGYLNLQVQTLQALLDQDKRDKLKDQLMKMRDAIQVAHADVREDILSLRTTLANDKGMIPAIADYVEEFGIQTKKEVEFVNEFGGEVNLSSLAQVQLVCILQEALSNARKHSRAQHVTVHLSKEGAGENQLVVLRVVDDGVGFVAGASKRSFGLQTMRERAQSVKGELRVASAPSKGTQIECRLPCLPPERLSKKMLVFQ